MVKTAKKPQVSAAEESYRKELFPVISYIKNKNVLCTSCNKSVKELMLRGKCKTHPFLDTLLCEKCHEFFGDGEFSVDEDGSDKYCRWCGQGGTLFLCSSCTAGFCKKCIKRNLPRSALNEVEDDNWKCYCCEVKPLYDLRALCWAAKKYFEEKGEAENTKKRKNKDESSSSEQEEARHDYKRKKGHSKNENKEKVKHSNEKMKDEHKKEIKVATKKLCDFLADTSKLIDVARKKAEEYKNKKSNKSLKSVEEVNIFSDKIDTVLEIVQTSAQNVRSNLKEYMSNWRRLVDENNKADSEIEEKNEKRDKPNNNSDNSVDKSPTIKEGNGSGDEADAEMKDKVEEVVSNGEEKSPGAGGGKEDFEEKSSEAALEDGDKSDEEIGKLELEEESTQKSTEKEKDDSSPMDTSEKSEEHSKTKHEKLTEKEKDDSSAMDTSEKSEAHSKTKHEDND